MVPKLVYENGLKGLFEKDFFSVTRFVFYYYKKERISRPLDTTEQV